MKKAAQSGKVPPGIITSEMKASLSDLPELEPAPIQNQRPSLMAAPQEGI